MSRRTKERDVCNDQTNVDYWISLGPDWLQRIMESPEGRLDSIFEVPKKKADVGQSSSLYGQMIFSKGIRQ